MKKHYRHDNNCLNCGSILNGKYCHHCGQENLEIKEDFVHMVNHAVSDYFHFDHQFFHTLKPLLLKPGKLTNEYMAGKRVQYLHPVKMYIFISLVYFLLVLSFKPNINPKVTVLTPQQKAHVADSLKKVIADNPKLSEAKINKMRKRIKNLQDPHSDDFVMYKSDVSSNRPLPLTYKAYLKQQDSLPEKERDSFFDRYAAKKNYVWKERQNKGQDIKEIIIDSFMHNIPKMMFVLLPLFALILKLAFLKNRKFYVEHLIFSIHFHCFVYLFTTLIILFNISLPDAMKHTLMRWINIAAVITIFWYLYRSLRTVYQRSRFRTFTKMAGVTLSYFLTVVLAFCILLLITVFVAA